MRRWSLSGFRLGRGWLDSFFGPSADRKTKPMFPRAKLELYPLEDRYHPNDPLGMLNTQVLGVLASSGLDLSPALTNALRGGVSDTRVVSHATASAAAYTGPDNRDGPMESPAFHLPALEGSGGGAPASDLHIDRSGIAAEQSDWSMGNDLWHDPFGPEAASAALGGNVPLAVAAGLSPTIVNPVAESGAAPTGGAGGFASGAAPLSQSSSTSQTSLLGSFSNGGPTSSPPRLGPSGSGGITEYNTVYKMRNLVSGPDGNLWATWNDALVPVAKITPTGTVYPTGTGTTASTYDITVGPDGLLWYTGQKPSGGGGGGSPGMGAGSNVGIIGKITTGGTVTEYTLANCTDPRGIVAGPDGNLWFDENDIGKIGKITTSGTVTEYAIPTASSGPEDIALGVDGNLWFTESSTNKIGKVTTSGSFTEYSVPTTGSTPFDITSGPDGNIWFTENAGNNIARFALPTGTFSEFAVPTSSSGPEDITSGPGGSLWFTENTGNNVGTVTTGGNFVEYAIPTATSLPIGITMGPDNNVWFAENGTTKVAKLTGIPVGPWFFGPGPLGNPAGNGSGLGPDAVGFRVAMGEWTVGSANGDARREHALDLNLNPGDNTDAVMGGPVALDYNSATNSPKPIVVVGYITDVNGSVPTSIQAQLTWNGTAQSAVTFSTTGHVAGDVYQLGLQVNSAVTVTSVNPWTVTITATYSGGVTSVGGVSAFTPIEVNGSTPYGPGWSLAAVDKLVAVSNGSINGVLWVHGTGKVRFFQSMGGNAYLGPVNDFGSLVKNIDNSYTYTAKDQTKWNFNSSGQLTSIVNPEGLTRSFAYASGLLSTITEPDGGVGTFNYSAGLLSTVNEPGGRTVTLTYASGNLSTIQDPDGALETFTYDGSNRVSNDKHGPLNTTIGYDSTSGIPNSVNQGLGVNETITPQAVQALATSPAVSSTVGGAFTDGLSHTTTYTLNGLTLTAAVQTADGATATTAYDFAVQPAKDTDPRGNVTSYTRDYYTGKGDVTKISYADGSTDQFQYDGTFHHVTVKIDGNGNRTTLAYDATTGDLTTFTNALNQTTTFAYYQTGGKDNGLVRSTTDALGNTTSFAYDSNRRMTQEIGAYGTSIAETATMIYDTAGNLLSETDGVSTTTSYDHHTTTSFAYDAMRRPTSVVEAYGSSVQRTTTLAYDGIGDLLSSTDPLGHITSFAYDQVGRTTTAVDGYGTSVASTTTMIFDNASNLLSETTGISSTASYDHHTTTSFGYDAVNRVNQVIQGYGSSVASTATMIYDAAGNLLSETDGISATSSYDHHATTSYGYDALNRVNKVITGYSTSVAVTATMIYDQAGNLLSETDGISTTSSYDHHATTSYGYDALNRVQSVVEAYGTSLVRRTTMAYDAAGNTLSVTDPLNHITSYGYDALNRVTTEIGAYSTSVAVTATMLYDAADNLLSETTGISSTVSYDNHATTSYAYDSLNRITQVIQAYGTSIAETATMLYDAADNLTSETTGISSTASYDHHATTSFGYDALNRPITEIDAYGVTGVQRTVTTVYDAAGNVQASIDALGNATTLTYDALNRTVTSQNPAGTTTAVYDAADNVVNTIDANGNKATFSYDALNRQITLTDPLGKVTTGTYDAASNVLTITDPDNNTTTFSYDTLNRITQQTDPLGHSNTYAYDAADRLTSVTNRLGRVQNATYDALDRLTGETWVVSGSTVNTITFTYDAASNMLTAADANGAYTMAFDQLGRMTSEQEPYSQALTFTYDAADNRLTRTDSQSGVATETYDALNRLVTYQFGGAGVTPLRLDQTWTVRDQLATQTRYSNLAGTTIVGTTSLGYDNAGRETRLQFKDAAGNNISNYTYSYDPGNRLTAETLNGVTTSYQYDADNQLTQAGTATFGYDANGNRTNTGYTTSTGNEMTNDGTWTYTYDNEGNLTQKSKGTNLDTFTYTYDTWNRLTGVTETNGGSTVQQLAFKYDVFGNRIDDEITINGVTTATHFAYDGDNAWADLSGSNALQMRRLYLDAPDALFARIDSGGTAAWYLTDRLGSVRDIANNTTGASIDHIDYGDGFGKVTNETNSANGDRYKFAGGELDSQTGLMRFGLRYYDSATGRWTSQDPSGLGAGDPNLYRYTSNSPTNTTDWTGLIGVINPGAFGALFSGPRAALDDGTVGAIGPPLRQLPKNPPKEVQLKPGDIRGPDGWDSVVGFIGPDNVQKWLGGRPNAQSTDWTNRAAGIGDKVSANFDKHIRQKFGFDEDVDYKSSAYATGQEGGEYINEAVDAASPLAGSNPFTAIPFALLKGIQTAGHAWDADEAFEKGDTKEGVTQMAEAIGTALQAFTALQGAFANCFPAGTLVATLCGLRAIETIESGEEVWAYDVVSSQWRACRVLQTFRRDYEGHSAFVTVAGETIESTLLHPYWVIRGEDLEKRPRRKHLPSVTHGATTPGRWVDAGDVRVGDELLLRDGRVVSVEGVRVTPYHGEVFNFAVEMLECYAVGYNGVLVHNINGAEVGDTEEHHSDPKFMGGDPKQETTTMPKDEHHDLHNDLNDFLRGKENDAGNHMRPQRGNSAEDIQKNFTRDELLDAAAEFYKEHGGDAARDFFKQHPGLK